MKTKKLALIITLILCGQYVFAQRVITGVITDKNQNPLEGVEISDVKNDIKTISGPLGNFSITLPDNSRELHFSKAGYKVEILAIENSNINLTMNLLSDVYNTPQN